MQAILFPDTTSGTPAQESINAVGVLTWVADGLSAEVRMCTHLFTEVRLDAYGKAFIEVLTRAA